jgi:hypothetical protein
MRIGDGRRWMFLLLVSLVRCAMFGVWVASNVDAARLNSRVQRRFFHCFVACTDNSIPSFCGGRWGQRLSWKRRGCLWVSGQQKTLTKAHPTPNRSLVWLRVCCYVRPARAHLQKQATTLHVTWRVSNKGTLPGAPVANATTAPPRHSELLLVS